MGTRGAVAAGHQLTADAGADVLREGGTAVDAALAAIAMACVTEPVLCSPGGGLFAMVRHLDGDAGTTRLVDAFVHTPRHRADDVAGGARDVVAEFGTAQQRFRIGPATTATPGLFPGLHALADRAGTVALTDLVGAAAEAARTGVQITPFQHHLANVVAPILTGDPTARALFAPDGHLLPAGSTFRNPGLADALEMLAADPLAPDVVESVVAQQLGRGHLTDADLATYEVLDRTPLTVEVAGARIALTPPPAAGGSLIAHTVQSLSASDATAVADALAATDRARRSGPLVRRRGTTHVSVVDGDGTVCSLTASNGEGNGEVVDGFGFMLNNMLGEDDVNPDGDRWPHDTRLSSMMSPTILVDRNGTVTGLGSGGSSRIPSAIGQVVAAVALGGADLREAIDAPRVHVDGGHLHLEAGLDGDEVRTLRRRFPRHTLWPAPDLFFGGVHAAQLTGGGELAAAGDARRSGAAVIVDG